MGSKMKILKDKTLALDLFFGFVGAVITVAAFYVITIIAFIA